MACAWYSCGPHEEVASVLWGGAQCHVGHTLARYTVLNHPLITGDQHVLAGWSSDWGAWGLEQNRDWRGAPHMSPPESQSKPYLINQGAR